MADTPKDHQPTDDERAVENLHRALQIIVAEKMRPDFDWREDAPYLFLWDDDKEEEPQDARPAASLPPEG